MGSADFKPNKTWDPKGKREQFLLKRFHSRLGHVLDSFRLCRSTMAGRRSFNESIGDLKTGQRPRARRAKRARLDPQIEFIIAWKLKERGIDEPKPAQVMRIAKELAKTLKPLRGRPRDRILNHHVEGLAALFEETSGHRILQSQTRNSVYRPALKGDLGRTLLQLIRTVDRQVTETAVANIIRAMPEPGSPDRKRFHHYFPLADHGGRVPDELPGFETKEVGVIWPIYCS